MHKQTYINMPTGLNLNPELFSMWIAAKLYRVTSRINKRLSNQSLFCITFYEASKKIKQRLI